MVVRHFRITTPRTFFPGRDYVKVHLQECGITWSLNVKINDLKHNIERGRKGRHKTLVKKHEDALAKIESYASSREM